MCTPSSKITPIETDLSSAFTTDTTSESVVQGILRSSIQVDVEEEEEEEKEEDEEVENEEEEEEEEEEA